MIGVGLVGYGNIGRTHVKAIAECAGVELVALSRRGGREPDDWVGDVPVCAGPAELAARADVDVVCICTPSGLHAAHAMEVVARGKHVVVEKPLAVRLADAQAVVDAAEDASVMLAVISQRRFEPAVRAIKDAVDSGTLGRPVLGEALLRWYRGAEYYAQADWRGTVADDGGALMNQGIHVVDLLRWFMGPVTEIAGAVDTLVHHIEAEDTAVASLRFANGALGVITATTATRPGLPGELNLFWEHGSVGLTESGISRWEVPGIPRPPDHASSASGAADPAAIGTEGHVRQWQEIAEALAVGRAPAVDGADALAALELVHGVYDAARTGVPVAL